MKLCYSGLKNLSIIYQLVYDMHLRKIQKIIAYADMGLDKIVEK